MATLGKCVCTKSEMSHRPRKKCVWMRERDIYRDRAIRKGSLRGKKSVREKLRPLHRENKTSELKREREGKRV